MTIHKSIEAMTDEEKFHIFLESKMLGGGISDKIIEQLESVKSKLFLNYDPLNEMDMHVLNTKIEHISQTELSGDYEIDDVFKIAFHALERSDVLL